MLDFLTPACKARLNILISGGTGSGKTTLLNVLSSFISERERIVTIEDAAELQLQQEHVVRLETRPPNIEGKGAVRQRQLVINALRMRPDRIIVGEVRGAEALDMLQAMNTGHDGSLTTIHANTPRDALARIETMIAMAATESAGAAMRQQIASADPARRSADALERRHAQGDERQRNHRHGRRHHHHAGDLPVREGRRDAGRQGDRPFPGHRRPAEVLRAASRVGYPLAGGHVRRRHRGALMNSRCTDVLRWRWVRARRLLACDASSRTVGRSQAPTSPSGRGRTGASCAGRADNCSQRSSGPLPGTRQAR